MSRIITLIALVLLSSTSFGAQLDKLSLLEATPTIYECEGVRGGITRSIHDNNWVICKIEGIKFSGSYLLGYDIDISVKTNLELNGALDVELPDGQMIQYPVSHSDLTAMYGVVYHYEIRYKGEMVQQKRINHFGPDGEVTTNYTMAAEGSKLEADLKKYQDKKAAGELAHINFIKGNFSIVLVRAETITLPGVRKYLCKVARELDNEEYEAQVNEAKRLAASGDYASALKILEEVYDEIHTEYSELLVEVRELLPVYREKAKEMDERQRSEAILNQARLAAEQGEYAKAVQILESGWYEVTEDDLKGEMQNLLSIYKLKLDSEETLNTYVYLGSKAYDNKAYKTALKHYRKARPHATDPEVVKVLDDRIKELEDKVSGDTTSGSSTPSSSTDDDDDESSSTTPTYQYEDPWTTYYKLIQEANNYRSNGMTNTVVYQQTLEKIAQYEGMLGIPVNQSYAVAVTTFDGMYTIMGALDNINWEWDVTRNMVWVQIQQNNYDLRRYDLALVQDIAKNKFYFGYRFALSFDRHALWSRAEGEWIDQGEPSELINSLQTGDVFVTREEIEFDDLRGVQRENNVIYRRKEKFGFGAALGLNFGWRFPLGQKGPELYAGVGFTGRVHTQYTELSAGFQTYVNWKRIVLGYSRNRPTASTWAFDVIEYENTPEFLEDYEAEHNGVQYYAFNLDPNVRNQLGYSIFSGPYNQISIGFMLVRY